MTPSGGPRSPACSGARRAEVAEADQRLAAGVLDLDAGRGRLVGDEHLVPGLLAEVDHHRRLDGQLAHPAAALHRDPAAGAGVA